VGTYDALVILYLANMTVVLHTIAKYIVTWVLLHCQRSTGKHERSQATSCHCLVWPLARHEVCQCWKTIHLRAATTKLHCYH